MSIASCSICHGEDLTGGQSPEPGGPFSPDLTPAGRLGGWSEEDFIGIMRAGQGEFMPWENYAKMTDTELGAIYRYLRSMPK
ncbi:MAG: c-type cytochrome [Thermoleophilia bacterium]|nr:c-type cytochrome [Thermoleophilia bacterium]